MLHALTVRSMGTAQLILPLQGTAGGCTACPGAKCHNQFFCFMAVRALGADVYVRCGEQVDSLDYITARLGTLSEFLRRAIFADSFHNLS